MKNLNLSYVLFGVFVVMIVTVLTCGKKETSNDVIIPETRVEEVIEEVQEQVEEVKEVITTTVEEKVEEIESRLEKALPNLDIPALKKEKAVEAPVEEAPVEVMPEEIPVQQDSTKVEDSSNE